MRSRPTNIRGRIGIIEQGTGLIVGEVKVSYSMPFEANELSSSFYYRNHRIKDIDVLKKYRHAWVFEDAKRYEKPIPYKHPQGAVVWVNIGEPACDSARIKGQQP